MYPAGLWIFRIEIKQSVKSKPFSQLRRPTMNMIKVSAASRTSAVAGAIAGIVREHHRAEIQAIGAGAVNQAVKALIIATGYLRLDGIYVACVPEFADVTIDDNVRTAIKLVVEPGHNSGSPETATVRNEGTVNTPIKSAVEPEASLNIPEAS
jgi:stage V sporulation protein S